MENKKLILDYSKWRCGGNSLNKLGEGFTRLLNKEGYQCCLGLFSPQLNVEISQEELLYKAYPWSLNEKTPKLFQDSSMLFGNELVDNAVSINDDEDTTPQEKIIKLKELFLLKGYEIEVINLPHS